MRWYNSELKKEKLKKANYDYYYPDNDNEFKDDNNIDESEKVLNVKL